MPSELGETASELRSLGALPWLSEEPNLTDAQRNSLIRLPMPQLGSSCFDRAHPLLLTGFMGLLYYGSRLDYDGVLDFGYGLTRRLPGNALVWSEFARRAWFSGKARLVELPVKQLTPNLRRFPRSYLFRTADSYMQRIAGRPAEGRKVAEIAVRCSTRNPDAWFFLNGSIGDQADAVRHARYIREQPSG